MTDESERTHTWDGHRFDDVSAPCEKCGFQRRPLPSWATPGAIFGLDGSAYRIVAVGSSNRDTPGHAHHQDQATVERLGDTAGPWALPAAGSTVGELATALRQMRELPTFYAHEIDRALVLLAPLR